MWRSFAPGFWKGPPDLAIEVLSPEDRPAAVRDKVEDHLEHGARLVLVVNPEEEHVTAFRRQVSAVTLREDDELELREVVPGFTCRVREIFEYR